METKSKHILASKRFWAAVGTVIAIVLTAFAPGLKNSESQLVQVVAIITEGVVGLVLIHAYTWQDVVSMGYTPLRLFTQSTTTTADDDMLNLMKAFLAYKYPNIKLVEPGSEVPPQEVRIGGAAH